MDGKPFRATRPTGGRASSSPEPVQRQAVAPAQQQVREDSPVAQRTTQVRPVAHVQKSPKRFIPWIIAVLAIILAVCAGLFTWASTKGTSLVSVDSAKYQAVFFTNGQVYFGKLQASSGDYMKMTDIFYLQNQGSTNAKADSSNPQEASSDQNNVQLVKLGKEIHGPEDEMIISRDQVLFYENLKTDGKVAQSIEKYKSSN